MIASTHTVVFHACRLRSDRVRLSREVTLLLQLVGMLRNRLLPGRLPCAVRLTKGVRLSREVTLLLQLVGILRNRLLPGRLLPGRLFLQLGLLLSKEPFSFLLFLHP